MLELKVFGVPPNRYVVLVPCRFVRLVVYLVLSLLVWVWLHLPVRGWTNLLVILRSVARWTFPGRFSVLTVRLQVALRMWWLLVMTLYSRCLTGHL